MAIEKQPRSGHPDVDTIRVFRRTHEWERGSVVYWFPWYVRAWSEITGFPYVARLVFRDRVRLIVYLLGGRYE